MSPKELLYIEDALGHVQQMKTECKQFSEQIQDPELKTLICELEKKHEQCFNSFYTLLG